MEQLNVILVISIITWQDDKGFNSILPTVSFWPISQQTCAKLRGGNLLMWTFFEMIRTGPSRVHGITNVIFVRMRPVEIWVIFIRILLYILLMQWRIQDFPEGGAWTLQGGREHAKFSRKLHEIERIWTPGGGVRPSRPPPPRSANVMDVTFHPKKAALKLCGTTFLLMILMPHWCTYKSF